MRNHPSMPHGLDEQRARKRANDALLKLIKLALEQGADEERIFQEFDIPYVPLLAHNELEETVLEHPGRRAMSDAEIGGLTQRIFGFAPAT